MEGVEAKFKILRKLPDRPRHSSHGRRIKVSQLGCAGLEYSLLYHEIPAITNVLSIFGHVIAVEVLH